MLKRDRGQIFRIVTFLTCVLLTAFLAILIFNSGWVAGNSDGEYTARSAVYADHAQEQIELCLSLVDNSDKAECIIKLTNTYNEQERSEANLVVQNKIEAWTFGMLVASMLTVGVTSIGIWYVRKTLIQANETNVAAVSAARAANEANLIMRQEARPWVTIKKEALCEIHDNGFALKISWNYDLINKGKSPAYDVKVDWKVVKRNHYQMMYAEAKEYAQATISKFRLKGTPIIFPGEKTDFIKYTSNGWARYDYDQSKISGPDKAHIVMFICLSYRLSLNSKDFGAEVIVVGFENDKRWLGPYATRMMEYSFARFIQ